MRKYFITGLLVLVPLSITLWVLNLIIGTLDQSLLLLPPEWQPVSLFGFHLPGFGTIVTLLIILLTGLVTRNIIGNRLLLLWERLLKRIPVVNSIYSSVKQVSDTLLSSSGVPQGAAGAMAVRRRVDHRLSYRAAGRRRGEPPRWGLRQRLRADDAESDRRLFRHAAAQRHD